MRTLLICPWAEEITEVQIPSAPAKQLDAIYHQLSYPSLDWHVDQVEQFRMPTGHTMLVDEEPHYKYIPPSFYLKNFGLLFGRALVLALSSDEDWVATSLSVESLKELISFNG